MSYEDWKAVTECKTTGSWNLHTLLPRDLSFFIMLSSASGVVGLRGQANYAAANTYMDALARLRVSQGEKAIALDLGAMTDDGLLAETPGFLERVLIHGALNGISRQQASGIFDHYCNPDLPVLEPTQSQSIIGLGSGAETDLDGLAISRQLLFLHIRHVDDFSTLNNASANDEVLDYKKLLVASGSLIEAGTIVSEALAQKLSRSLSAMQGEVDMQRPLHSYGVDSLLAVELRSWISRQFGADVPVFEIQGGSSLATLGILVASKSEMKHAEWTV